MQFSFFASQQPTEYAHSSQQMQMYVNQEEYATTSMITPRVVHGICVAIMVFVLSLVWGLSRCVKVSMELCFMVVTYFHMEMAATTGKIS